MGAVEEELHPAMLHHTLQQHPMGHGPPPGWAGWAPPPNFPQQYGYLPSPQSFGPPFFPAGPPMQLYQYGPPPPSFPMMAPFPQPMMTPYGGAAWPDKAEHQSRADALVGSDQRRWAGMPLESLENEIVELAFSRNGSLYLQSKLSAVAEDERGALVTTADPQAFAMILRELGPVLDKVMQDKYGSYLTRWLVQLSTSEQRVQIWRELSDTKLVETCCTHSVRHDGDFPFPRPFHHTKLISRCGTGQMDRPRAHHGRSDGHGRGALSSRQRHDETAPDGAL